jgi:outer membrane protein
MRKAVILGIAVMTVALFAGTSLAQGGRVAVIDINKILNESDEGMAAKRKMEARYTEIKKSVDAKQEEARKLKEEIDKQKVMLGKEKLKEKEDALQAKLNELRQMTQKGEEEMQAQQGEMTREVFRKVKVQVDAVVKAQNIALVLEKSAGVIYFDEPLDITQQVLDRMQKVSKEAKGKEPQQQKKADPKKGAGGGK